jgi:1-deoxy-D-xylulose-5-phosphate reductoisomerase
MKIPSQYALSYPERYKLPDFDFNIKEFSNLELYDVDMEKFSCIALAFDAIKKGGSNPVVLNVANDLAVELFLNKKIKFNQIPELIKDAMNNHKHIDMPSLSDILSITKLTENYINSRFKL